MKPLSRRGFLGAVGAAGAMAWHAGAARAQTRKPNIIFILADDLGYGDLGCYGQQQILTPHLDAMAREGMLFTQCYAGSTVCAPSRSCLMTGQHTGHTRIRGNARVPLRPEDRIAPEVLRANGYRTALIGKWGLGNPGTTGEPRFKGFEYSFGYMDQGHAHNYYPEILYRNGAEVRLEGNEEDPPGVAVKRAQYSHDLFMQEAVDYVRANADEPFFLYLALTIPHANNEKGREDGDGMEVPDYAPYTDKDWPQVNKGHAAMITRMDTGIGRLMAQLEASGIDEDTIVFFSSDNGPHKEGGADPAFFNSSGGLRGYKRDLYEGGIRVPMIVRWPGHVAAGSKSDLPWAFWDFLPTVCELAGVPAPANMDGVSVLPTLTGQGEQTAREYLYWEFHERGTKQAARKGEWKAVRFYGDRTELYNLSNDLAEQHDRAADNPDLVAEFNVYLDGARTESEHWPLRKVAAST